MASSTIAQNTFIRGAIRGDGDLDILGRVEGSVDVGGDLLIAEGALIKSDVSGRRVTVRGAVAGNVAGTESLVLEPGAKVVGDLSAPSIGIRPGALVRGNVSTQPGTERPVAQRRPAIAAQSTRASAPTPRAPSRVAAPVSAPQRTVPVAPPPPPKKEEPAQTAPPPVVPTLKKGAKAQLRKKGAR
jgi:cytoskeletal protein CcmA (bactofilin family)